MPDLYTHSLDIIRSHQHAGGAYVACPNFPTYCYCWFRDGSFIAHAMDLAGEPDSAARFHGWVARSINRRADQIAGVIASQQASTWNSADTLHCRLTLEGEEGTLQEWTNFQLDGFGTWLWAIEQHRQTTGAALPAEWLSAARLIAGYLAALWPVPCYDCWEEHGDKVHPHTLAAIYGGLAAFQRLAGEDCYASTLAQIRAVIEEQFTLDGHFVKFSGSSAVDASLLGLSVPYQVFPPDDPRMKATAAEIERTLRVEDCGVHRYAADTYYGGGEWVLLTAWLGWYYHELAASGAADEALCNQRIDQILDWIEHQANPDGDLPEQVPAHLNDPAYYQPWVERWGAIASPLLWSHAEYIILYLKRSRA